MEQFSRNDEELSNALAVQKGMAYAQSDSERKYDEQKKQYTESLSKIANQEMEILQLQKEKYTTEDSVRNSWNKSNAFSINEALANDDKNTEINNIIYKVLSTKYESNQKLKIEFTLKIIRDLKLIQNLRKVCAYICTPFSKFLD